MLLLPTLKFAAFLALLGAASVTDLRERRLPNRLTMAGLGVGLAFGFVAESGFPFGALGGAAAGLALGFALFAIGALGAGDAKLLAAVGAFLGPLGLASAALYAAVAGGVLAVAAALRRGTLLHVLAGTRDLVLHIFTRGRAGSRPRNVDAESTVPYGVAIAAGAIAAWFFPGLIEGLL